MDPGISVYTTWLNERGGIESDLTVNRLDEDRFLVVTAFSSQIRDADWIARNTPADARMAVTDVTSSWAVLGVFGPRSREILCPLTDADLGNDAFPFGTLQEIDLGYARAIAIRRTYMGELGWEVYVPTEFAAGVFDTLWESGQPEGLVPAGYHAMNSLRMEKAYRHWGDDIADEDTPLEAGLSWGVAWEKSDGFIGREALEALERSWEVLYCDDGSTDGSFELLDSFAAGAPRVRVLSFRRNFGQTAALAAGFEHATGKVVVAMDADLQNRPEDIHALLARLDEGFDVVSASTQVGLYDDAESREVLAQLFVNLQGLVYIR